MAIKPVVLCFCFVMLALSLAGCAANPSVETGSIEVHSENIHAKVAFTDDDSLKINDYYKKNYKYKELPPGLAKKQELPPGLQKQIVKYGELPPGLEGRMLPIELERTLSRLPGGYIRLKIGGDIVLVNEETMIVVDVVWGVD
jgi:hypothetical protein